MTVKRGANLSSNFKTVLESVGGAYAKMQHFSRERSGEIKAEVRQRNADFLDNAHTISGTRRDPLSNKHVADIAQSTVLGGARHENVGTHHKERHTRRD